MSYNPNNPNGSAVSASSAPVVIASDQLAISTKDTVIASVIPTATVMQNAAVALGNGVNLNVQGYVSALISVTGTLGAGTAITFEASTDDTTFVAITGHQIGFAGNLTTVTISTGDFRFSCAAYKSIRARISSYSTGTITAKGYASPLAGHPTTVNSNIIASLPTGTNSIGTVKMPDIAITNSLAAVSATAVTAVNNQGIVAVQLTGTWVGTIVFQGTEDPLGASAPSTSFFNVNGVASVSGSQVTASTSNGQFRINSGGYTAVRAFMTAFTSGSATAWINASMSASMATLAEPLPAGINSIGTVGTTSAVINVGQKVVATTATQINATSTVPTNGIIVQAFSTNTASIFVGGVGVTTTTGFELTIGQSMSFSANLNTLYIVSVASTTDKICWNVE